MLFVKLRKKLFYLQDGKQADTQEEEAFYPERNARTQVNRTVKFRHFLRGKITRWDEGVVIDSDTGCKTEHTNYEK